MGRVAYNEIMKVSGKVFVVTGAGGGIGGQIVLELLRLGAQVAAVDLHAETLEMLASRYDGPSTMLSIHAMDITDKSAVDKLPEHVKKHHRYVDGLINCAGIIQPFVRVNDLDYQAIDRVMSVNFYGSLYMTKAFLPDLLKRPEAHVVNVSSMGGFLPVPGQSVYGASKAAVKLLTEGLYAELLSTSVRVSLVFPGATATNITQNSGVDIKPTPGTKSYPMLSAAAAAKVIVKGIEHDKPQIFTGRDSKLMNILYRLSPVFATKLIARQMKSLLS